MQNLLFRWRTRFARREAFTFWQMIIVLVVLGLIAAILFPIFVNSSPAGGSRRSACQSNLKQIALGIKQYIQDYDERFPLVNAGKVGWMDSLQLYVKNSDLNPQVFQCPTEAKGIVEGTTDYFYNSRMSGVYEASVWNAAATVMNGDGVGNSPANASVARLPKGWTVSEKAPSRRHLDGANYAFADGHVKWLKHGVITNANPTSTVNTFAPW